MNEGRKQCEPSQEGYPLGGWQPTVLYVAKVCVVVLDPALAPRDQRAWAFTQEDDARAVVDFLNKQLGAGEEVAWVELVPLARTLNKDVLRYLDCWAEVAEETLRDDE